MKRLHVVTVIVAFFIGYSAISAQITTELTDIDKSALEGVIVEKYYLSDSADFNDSTGGVLPVGSVTYRIYIDLKKGYTLQAVYGLDRHPLRIETSSFFFNNTEGDKSGDKINSKNINRNTLALDSWLTLGSATNDHFGILKTDDKDSSIIKRKTLNNADGLVNNFKTNGVILFGPDFSFVDDTAKSHMFYTEDGAWAALGGVKGTTDDNKVLIAQLTTTGKLSFELNILVGQSVGKAMRFVAHNPEEDEILFNGLTFKSDNW